MAERESEETLSISLVDGISCGLAAALLLFIIFGINISISKSSLGGVAGHGTVTKIPSDLPGEPVDIFVEVHGPAAALRAAGSAKQKSVLDHVVVNEAQGTILFIRELKAGFGQLNGVQAPRDKIAFNLDWSGAIPPYGVIHIFRSGTDSAFAFHCERPAARYSLISAFDTIHAVLKGDCNG
jgi:hypothetical protein